MTGTYDETWFNIVSVSVEVEGGAALQPLLDAMQAVRQDDLTTVIANLKKALSQLEKVGKQLGKEACKSPMTGPLGFNLSKIQNNKLMNKNDNNS